MKVATSTSHIVHHFGEERALEIIAEAGFDGVDFGMFHLAPDGEVFTRLDDGDFKAYFERIGARARSAGIAVNQTHAPFPLWSPDAERDKMLRACAVRSIYATAYMDSEYVVVHPAIPSVCIYGRRPDLEREVNVALYGELIPHLRATGVKCAVENMFSVDPDTRKLCPCVCSTAEQMNAIIDEMNGVAGEELFVACLDTGHAAISGTGAADMQRRLGSRVKVLHVQDNNGLYDAHTVPGLGKINFTDFAAALAETEYDGMFNFEADNFYAAFGPELIPESARMMAAIGRKIVKNL